MDLIHEVFRLSPELALFLSLAVGTWIGKFKLGAYLRWTRKLRPASPLVR
ncbi:hypothetical protein ACFQW4_02025 [Pantoea sp. GCM10028869]